MGQVADDSSCPIAKFAKSVVEQMKILEERHKGDANRSWVCVASVHGIGQHRTRSDGAISLHRLSEFKEIRRQGVKLHPNRL